MNILQRHYQEYEDQWVQINDCINDRKRPTSEEITLVMTLQDMADTGKSRSKFYVTRRDNYIS